MPIVAEVISTEMFLTISDFLKDESDDFLDLFIEATTLFLENKNNNLILFNLFNLFENLPINYDPDLLFLEI